MQLGERSQIAIGTADLKKSIELYNKLGFKVVAQNSQPNNWAQISDDTVIILLNEDSLKYIGLIYFNPKLNDMIGEIESAGATIVNKTETDDGVQQAIFQSPDGFAFSVVNHDASKMHNPVKDTLATFDQGLLHDPSQYPNEKIGIFGELCYPVKNLDESINFWGKLGFEVKSKNSIPYPWGILYDGQNILGLHQTDDFASPAITYFAPDMADRVKSLKNNDVDNIDVFTGTGGGTDANVILNTPEGQQFFLFSL